MQNTCVGVVFWMSGFLVPLSLLAIVSRIFLALMKRTKSNIKVKSEVFTPLVNLLLFNEFKTSDFNSENEKLSEEYIEAVKTVDQMDIGENIFFMGRIQFYLSELLVTGRKHIFDIILEKEPYIMTMVIFNIMENNLQINEENSFLSQKKILMDLIDFNENGKFNRVILLFFIFQFEHIMYLEFTDKHNISKDEYNKLIESLSELKVLMN